MGRKKWPKIIIFKQEISKPEYARIHGWLRWNFTKTDKCESLSCLKNNKNFEWALLNGKTYEKKRENFIVLCRSCHRKYDLDSDARLKIARANNKILTQLYCRDGHEFTEKNTQWIYNRHKIDMKTMITRRCKICSTNSNRIFRKRKKIEKTLSVKSKRRNEKEIQKENSTRAKDYLHKKHRVS